MEPDERLMRSIEEKIDIPDSRKDDFRREIMNFIGALAVDGKEFEYDTTTASAAPSSSSSSRTRRTRSSSPASSPASSTARPRTRSRWSRPA